VLLELDEFEINKQFGSIFGFHDSAGHVPDEEQVVFLWPILLRRSLLVVALNTTTVVLDVGVAALVTAVDMRFGRSGFPLLSSGLFTIGWCTLFMFDIFYFRRPDCLL
jgi:hypothetical protein